MPDLHINGFDYVVIRVKDLERSAQWYQRVLGLKRYQPEAWGPFPIFMLAGRSGIALFPKRPGDPDQLQRSDIDHFAFNVDMETLHQAKERYTELGLRFDLQDHTYFHSIYTQDPDGHTVELTAIVVAEDDFYKDV